MCIASAAGTAAVTQRGGPPGERPRVVVLGGGFAGVHAAMALERARRRNDFDLLLVSSEDSLLFQPLLAEVLSGSLGPGDVVAPLRRLLPRTEIHVREVLSIDLQARTVTARSAIDPRARELRFDHLVLALGTIIDLDGRPGLREHGLPFRELVDVLRLRHHAVRAIEAAASEPQDLELRRSLSTFVVVGGGLPAVEVAAKLNDFLRTAVARHTGLAPSELRVVLLHPGDRVLPELSPCLALFAQDQLRARGIEVRLRARVQAATAEGVLLANGEWLAARTLVVTEPSALHPVVAGLPLSKTLQGRLLTDTALRALGQPGVWAAGDCARVASAAAAPPSVHTAIRQAEVLAANVAAAIRGRAPTRTFAFERLGRAAALGRRNAVVEFCGVGLSGFLAWGLLRSAHLSRLPGWNRRLKVVASWTLDLFLAPESTSFRLGGGAGNGRERLSARRSGCPTTTAAGSAAAPSR